MSENTGDTRNIRQIIHIGHEQFNDEYGYGAFENVTGTDQNSKTFSDCNKGVGCAQIFGTGILQVYILTLEMIYARLKQPNKYPIPIAMAKGVMIFNIMCPPRLL